MVTSKPPPQTAKLRADWSDLSEQELAEVRRDFDEGDAEYRRGECVPADDVLPRFRRAG